MQGRVINLNGGVYKVLLEDDTIIEVKARGKLRSEKKTAINDKSQSKKEVIQTVKNSPKVGDIVVIENNMIDHYLERKNSLIRPDIANVDQILLVFAAKEPDFSFYLLDMFIVNITMYNIKPLIVISKIDKLAQKELEELKKAMEYYKKLSFDVVYVNSLTKEGTLELAADLDNKITVLSGQTGAGKSTLINAIIPEFNLKTQEISQALGRGKHTTRESNLYRYKNGFIGDTPGFSKLDLFKVDKNELRNYFPEFKNYECKFRDCLHQENIKGCLVHEAALKGEILYSRYENYLKMFNQIGEIKK